MAYSSRGFHGNEYDNRDIIIKIVNLRLEMANILGFNNFAAMTLGDRMADTQAKVEKFLKELYEASKPAAIRDFENVSQVCCKYWAIRDPLNAGTGHFIQRN